VSSRKGDRTQPPAADVAAARDGRPRGRRLRGGAYLGWRDYIGHRLDRSRRVVQLGSGLDLCTVAAQTPAHRRGMEAQVLRDRGHRVPAFVRGRDGLGVYRRAEDLLERRPRCAQVRPRDLR